MKKHIHCDVIKAYADGAEIQVLSQPSGIWSDVLYPAFRDHLTYRIKPPVNKKDELLKELKELEKRIKEVGCELCT